jgi:hypothetical protein
MTRNVRDSVLFFSGLAGVGYVLVIGAPEPSYVPPLLVLFATMMGLPALLRKDEKNGS